MNKKDMRQRLRELRKMPLTEEVKDEIIHWEMQLNRINDNEATV